MTDPMRHNLKKGPAKKGIIESTERFVKLTYALIESEAWRWLRPISEAVYIELRRRYNGLNNGKISLSLAEAARVLRASKSSIQKALVELEEHGLIKVVKRGYFTGRMASEYALTDEQLDGYPPTREWRRWQPTKPHRRRQIRAIGIQTILTDMRTD
ncbi:helix-turn-helix domain-containing protein [bacterium]|nr:helix-turn-helix domain-containing protein [bacterium]